MTLKNFLKLVRADELISLYDLAHNVYICQEKCKDDHDRQYDQCRVTGVNTNVTHDDYAILEIDIWTL